MTATATLTPDPLTSDLLDTTMLDTSPCTPGQPPSLSLVPTSPAALPVTAEAPAADDAPVFDALAHQLLDARAETDLAKRIEVGIYATHLLDTATDPQYRAELEWLAADGSVAREVFIQSNLRLALATSRKFRTRGHTEDDVIQDAYHGLVKAVDRFDYTKGFKFSTYAVWWIRESILTGLRGTGFVRHPEVLWNQIVKVRAVRLRLLDETGTMPTDAAIAAACGFSVREVARCVHADRRVTSLQTPVGEHDMTLGDLISDDAAAEVFDAVEDGVDRKAMCGIVSAALAGLDPSVAAVVLARYGLDGRAPRSLSVVAEELGLHRQTVRHREQTGLYALRHPDVASRLREYRSLST